MEERLRGRSARVIKVETQKDTITAQEQFAFEVGEALSPACEELESACEGVNRDFAQEVDLAASKLAMSRQQVEKVLADFGGNEADISIGRGWSLPGVDERHRCPALRTKTAHAESNR
jgi:hypothetical protein